MDEEKTTGDKVSAAHVMALISFLSEVTHQSRRRSALHTDVLRILIGQRQL
jgi:hypothetical protein